MIQSIAQVLDLPCVRHNKLSKLPQSKGVYFVVSPDHKLLYIGATSNLKGRFPQHHRKHQILSARASVFYLEIPEGADTTEVESVLIDLLDPEWNVHKHKADALDHRLCIRIEPDLKERAHAVAERRNESVAEVVRRCLVNYVRRHEREKK